jgi:hypothetical protein
VVRWSGGQVVRWQLTDMEYEYFAHSIGSGKLFINFSLAELTFIGIHD